MRKTTANGSQCYVYASFHKLWRWISIYRTLFSSWICSWRFFCWHIFSQDLLSDRSEPKVSLWYSTLLSILYFTVCIRLARFHDSSPCFLTSAESKYFLIIPGFNEDETVIICIVEKAESVYQKVKIALWDSQLNVNWQENNEYQGKVFGMSGRWRIKLVLILFKVNGVRIYK